MSPRLESALDDWRLWARRLTRRPTLVRPLTGGLTNQSWLIAAEDELAVVRINSLYDEWFAIDRERERIIYSAVADAGIAPALWYCAPEQGIMVTAFIPGQVWGEAELADGENCRRLQATLAPLQKISLPLPKFDYWCHLNHYEAVLLRQGVQIPEELAALKRRLSQEIKRFQQSGWQMQLVHHDLGPGNILATDKRLYVIDWEYAALGHPSMDRLAATTGEPQPVIALLQHLINEYWLLIKAAIDTASPPPQ